jgi:hypothetical protein
MRHISVLLSSALPLHADAPLYRKTSLVSRLTTTCGFDGCTALLASFVHPVVSELLF